MFHYETNESVKVDIAPLNEAVDIPEFDYSRKEVEVSYFMKMFIVKTNILNM